jgi:hypothetical protein
MLIQEEDPELRSELQTITGNSGFKQVADIAALRRTHPHSISLVRQSSETPHGYNCFMYALGLTVLPDKLVALSLQHDDVFPSARFMETLVNSRLQAVRPAEAEDDDLVVYFDEHGKPRHAGIVRGDYVVSKWGRGHLWKHQLFEIPLSYGIDARFYRRIDPEEALRLYEAFAHSSR